MDEPCPINQEGTRLGEIPPKVEAEIRRLIKRASGLTRRSDVADTATWFLGGTRLYPPGISRLLNSLSERSGKRWVEKLLSARVLGYALLHEQRQAAIDILIGVLRDACRVDRLGRLYRGVVRVYWSSMIVAGLLIVLSRRWSEKLFWEMYTALFTIFVIPGLLISTTLEQTRMNRVRAAAADALKNLRAVESLDSMTEILTDPWPKKTAGFSRVQKAVKDAFLVIAESLTSDYYGKLPMQTVPHLCRLLHDSDDRIVLAALDALEKIGDGRAFEPVNRLLGNARTPEIRDAAQRAFEVIFERYRQEKDASRLLRPAEAQTDADSLLRPAASAPSDVPVLLRPAGQNDTP